MKHEERRSDSQIKPPVSDPACDIVASAPHVNLSDGTLPAAERAKLKLVYHDTPAENIKWIFRFGIYLSSSYGTVSSVLTTYNYSDPRYTNTKVIFALDIPADDLVPGVAFYNLAKSDQPAKLPEALREHLYKLDRFYSPNDASADGTRKPFWIRNPIKGAHKLLEQEREGNLRHYELSCINVKETLRINQGNPHLPDLSKYLNELTANGGAPIYNPASFQESPLRKFALDFLAAIYKRLPVWKTRETKVFDAFREEAKKMQDSAKHSDESGPNRS